MHRCNTHPSAFAYTHIHTHTITYATYAHGYVYGYINAHLNSGVSVKSFQAPSAGEKEEIFTQRFDAHLPKIGTLKIFNRSLYESVTTEPLIQPITEEAYESICHKINDWEKNLSDNGVTVIKFYLHISHQEQKRRFARRLESRQTSWQLLEKIKGKSAFLKRRMWGKNKEYYEKSIINTNTNNAPW